MKKLFLIPALVVMTSSGAIAGGWWTPPSSASVHASDFTNRSSIKQDIDIKWSKGADATQIADVTQANVVSVDCHCFNKVKVHAYDFTNKSYVNQDIDIKGSKGASATQAAIVSQTNGVLFSTP